MKRRGQMVPNVEYPDAASSPLGVVIATEGHDIRYMRVVLREDQFDLIRQIVREELESVDRA